MTAKTAKKPGTAVAAPKGTALVNMKDAIAKELADLQNRTGNPGGDQIRTAGKKFKFPDGTEHPGPVRLVIVDFVPGRFFYDRPFDPKNPSAPACAAISPTFKDMAPPKDVPDRQSDTCATCPNNEFGSAGDGKACKETRILAVIPEDADMNTTVSVLHVSPTALKGFDSYVRSLAATTQKAPFQVITEVKFDENSDFPTLRFGNPEPAPDDLVAVAYGLREQARQRIMTYPDFTQYQPLKQVARGGAKVRR